MTEPSAADLLGILVDRGGVATSADFGRGSRYLVEKLVADGEMVRLAVGRYAHPQVDSALAAAFALGGARSHLSAAQAHGWEVLVRPERPTVTVPVGRNVPRSQQRYANLHWGPLSTHERRTLVTEPLRTVLAVASSRPFPEGLAVADSALRSGRVGLEELRRAGEKLAGRGATRARRVAALADARSAGPFESGLRAVVSDVEGLALTPQGEIRDGSFFARVDLADTTLGIVLEADSFSWHGDRRGFERDCRRYVELTVRGWIVLRFTWHDVVHDPQWVRERVVEAVAMRRQGTIELRPRALPPTR